MNEHDATELAFKNGYKKGAMDVLGEIINVLKYTRFASDIEKKGTLAYIYSLKKKYTEGKP